jgi:hypothetical protein
MKRASLTPRQSHSIWAMAACAAVMLAWSCSDSKTKNAAWQIVFADPALEERAEVIDTWLVQGSCDSGNVVYQAALKDGTTPPAPPALPEGQYALIARARDAQCMWYAAGCTEMTLPPPDGTTYTVVLQATAAEIQAPNCTPGDSGSNPPIGSPTPPPSDDIPPQPSPTYDGGLSLVDGGVVIGDDGSTSGDVPAGGSCQGWASTQCTAGLFCKTPTRQCGGTGICTAKPKSCSLPSIGSVCGCDGQEYSTECHANQQGVSIDSSSLGGCSL